MYPSISIVTVLSARRLLRRISFTFKTPTRPALVAAALVAGSALFGATPAEARYTSIIIDAESGAVIENDGADVRNYPASLTKMMTLYLTFEALDAKRLRLDQDIPVSHHAEMQAPSKLGLPEGDTIKIENAILAVVTKSANDMAVALAEAQAGSEAAFALRMTQKAQSLGMANTSFRNASGLPNDQQMTTARDLATLGLALIQDWPQYYRYFSRTSFSYNGQTMANHNHLMSRYPGMDGIKTGFINKSGFNLAASAVRNGHRLVAVVMGGPSARARDNYMASLLDAAFRRVGTGGKAMPAPVMVHNGAPEPQIADAVAAANANASAGDQDDDQDQVGQVIKASATVPAAPAHSGGGAGGGWQVHLGAFKTQAAGRRALDGASRHLPAGASHVNAVLRKSGNRHHKGFRATLVGFKDEKTALTACSKIRVKGHACTVAPAGR